MSNVRVGGNCNGAQLARIISPSLSFDLSQFLKVVLPISFLNNQKQNTLKWQDIGEEEEEEESANKVNNSCKQFDKYVYEQTDHLGDDRGSKAANVDTHKRCLLSRYQYLLSHTKRAIKILHLAMLRDCEIAGHATFCSGNVVVYYLLSVEGKYSFLL